MTPTDPAGAATAAALERLPATRRAILLHLRAEGEAGAADLAGRLGVSAGAVRQQIRPLVQEGWVEHRDLRPGPGRPRRRYRLSAGASALFPQGYGDLAVEVLTHIADEDAAVVERAFARRRDARIKAARSRVEDAGDDLPARVAAVAEVLDEQGYMAASEDDADGIRLVERNCAILGVARRHRCACSTELDFLRALLPDASIERVEHIAAGSAACAYRIRPAGGG